MGNCGVSGALTAGSLACTGALYASTLSSTGSLAVSGAVSTGALTVSSLSSTNNITVGGDANIAGTLTVNGSTVGGSSLSAMPNNGLIISSTDIALDHDNGSVLGYVDRVADSGGWSNGTRWNGYYPDYPS